MAKEIIYDEKKHAYLVKEDYQSNDEAVFWANCPYNKSEQEKINKLKNSYTNALNSTEWLAEKEAKMAFLEAGDMICTFFSSKKEAKKQLIEDLKETGEEFVLGSMFNYIVDQIPEEIKDKFRSEVKTEENDQGFMAQIFKGRQVNKNTNLVLESLAGVKEIKEIKKQFTTG